MSDRQVFLLQRVQPAMTGLIDGSLSTLAPIFAVALATKEPHVAFYAGLATAIGAAISMAFSEGLSDTGEFTGRGNPVVRGASTGGGTFVGGILHTLPFLIPHYRIAIISALVVVGFELVTLAWLRWRFFEGSFARALATAPVGGVVRAPRGAEGGGGRVGGGAWGGGGCAARPPRRRGGGAGHPPPPPPLPPFSPRRVRPCVASVSLTSSIDFLPKFGIAASSFSVFTTRSPIVSIPTRLRQLYERTPSSSSSIGKFSIP